MLRNEVQDKTNLSRKAIEYYEDRTKYIRDCSVS